MNYLIIVNILCFLDTLIKYLLLNEYTLIKSHVLTIKIKKVYNYGFAHGLHYEKNIFGKIVLHLLMVTLTGIFYLVNRNVYVLAVFFASQYNLFDRIKNGYIIDYIHINFMRKNLPIFNVTDIVILMNLLLFII